jgi:hypothetical protein
MAAEGVDASEPAARAAWGQRVHDRFVRDMTAFVRQLNSGCTIFYNAGHVGPRHRKIASAFTHFELESLPSGGWGYLHFPLTMRYARTLGLDCLGMTGKFHTSWGDFASFKNPAALQFECFHMLALGAKCSVGDQLPPSGRIDRDVYDLVGSVYASVEEKEPWCRGARAVSEVAVVTPEAFGSTERVPRAAAGAVRILQEGGHQFDVVDDASDFGAYSLVVLPDEIPVSGQLEAKLVEYLGRGGAVLASFESGMKEGKTAFAEDIFGVRLAGAGPLDREGRPARGRPGPAWANYVLPRGEFAKGLRETPYAMDMLGVEVAARDDAEVLAPSVPSLFDRTWEHYCSHRQTPPSGKTGYPAVVRRGNVVYFSHPVFRQYHETAPLWCKRLVLNAIGLLLPEPLVRHDGPSTVIAALSEQEAEKRLVLHLLHYIPERRGRRFDTIEDVIPLFDIGVSVKVKGKVKSVRLAPSGGRLDFAEREGRVELTVPRLEGHAMVVLDLA